MFTGMLPGFGLLLFEEIEPTHRFLEALFAIKPKMELKFLPLSLIFVCFLLNVITPLSIIILSLFIYLWSAFVWLVMITPTVDAPVVQENGEKIENTKVESETSGDFNPPGCTKFRHHLRKNWPALNPRSGERLHFVKFVDLSDQLNWNWRVLFSSWIKA